MVVTQEEVDEARQAYQQSCLLLADNFLAAKVKILYSSALHCTCVTIGIQLYIYKCNYSCPLIQHTESDLKVHNCNIFGLMFLH
jgi:hypothetical protein